MEATRKLVDLGCANGWEEVPPEVRACLAAEHRPQVDSRRTCRVVHTCRECGITWTHDESDCG